MSIENPYFNLWKGEDVSLDEIRKVSHGMLETVRTMLKLGCVIGQGTLEGDVILWMPKAKVGKREYDRGSP